MANLFRANKKGSGGIQVESLTVTTMPTKTSYVVNETLDLTGLVVTATFADGVTANVTSAITTSPADGDTLTTEGTIPVTVIYQGATTSFNITCSALPASLEDATWAQIKTAAQNGLLSQFASEGDTKTVTFGGHTFHVKLASINDGTGTAAQYYPNGTADFITVELLPDKHSMNTTNTNAGGWNSSNMRSYLNQTVYPTLPSDLKAVIVEKTHMRTAGNSSPDLISASDKLWLPTYYEMFGQNDTHYREDSDHNIHYSIFPDNASRIKHMINLPSQNQSYTLSSPYIEERNFFFGAVSSSGTSDYLSAQIEFGVALCFRV